MEQHKETTTQFIDYNTVDENEAGLSGAKRYDIDGITRSAEEVNALSKDLLNRAVCARELLLEDLHDVESLLASLGSSKVAAKHPSSRANAAKPCAPVKRAKKALAPKVKRAANGNDGPVEGMTDIAQSVVDYCSSRDNVAASDIVAEFKIKPAKASRILGDLTTQGLLVRTGERRWARYSRTSKDELKP